MKSVMDFVKKGIMVKTNDHSSPVYIGLVLGEVIMARQDGVLKLHPMLAHILANTLDGMSRQELDVAEITDNDVTVHVARNKDDMLITINTSQIKFPAIITGNVVGVLSSVIPWDDLHWLAPGMMPMWKEADNGIIPAPAGQEPQFLPPRYSFLVVGDTFCGCQGGLATLQKCSPRCEICLANPSYKKQFEEFYKHGGRLQFFYPHPMCN